MLGDGFVDSVDERLRVANEAVAAADALADTEVIVRVLNDTVYPLMVPWLLDQSMNWSERALRLAADVGDPVLHFNVAVSRVTLGVEGVDFEEMDRACTIVGRVGHTTRSAGAQLGVHVPHREAPVDGR